MTSGTRHPEDQPSLPPHTTTVALLPGLLAASALAAASLVASPLIAGSLGLQRSPVSPVAIALLLGVLVGNALQLPARMTAGLRFAMVGLLRLGIVLLGIQLSVPQVVRLGAIGLPIVAACVAAALLVTLACARALRLSERLGTLIAVGTSICGVSAIAAVGPIIHAKKEETAYAIAVITLFGLAATITYPYAAPALLGNDPVRVGLLLGTSIHDTSQVTGAALMYSQLQAQPDAVNVAVLTKLIRNTLMAIVIPLAAFLSARQQAAQRRLGGNPATPSTPAARVRPAAYLPSFVLGFLAMAALRSIGDATLDHLGGAFGVLTADSWATIHRQLASWAANLMVVALAAVGLSTRIGDLRRLGVTPLVAGLAAAAGVGLIAWALISRLPGLIAA